MRLFILFVFGVYGGVHAYVFLMARQAFCFGWPVGVPLGLFMLFMVGAIFLIRPLERNDLEFTAPTLSWIAYLWMAAIFLYFCGALVLDLANLALRVPAWLGFEGLTITLEEDGDTLLTGPVVDQAALFGLLKKVRDLGMPLVSIHCIEPGNPELSSTSLEKEN